MELLDKLRDRSALVSVIGLGYAGLPLAVAFAEALQPEWSARLSPS